MATRGRKKKNITLEEEIIELEQEAAECEDKIKEITSKKKELKQIIEQKQMEALYQAVAKSGKSIDEVIALINADSQEEGQEGM